MLGWGCNVSLHIDILLKRTRFSARNRVDELPADLGPYLRVELYAYDVEERVFLVGRHV